MLPLPGPWASHLPSHQILSLRRASPALLFAGAVEGARSRSPPVTGAHIQLPLQPTQPSGEIRGKLLLLRLGREAAVPGTRAAADIQLCKASTVQRPSALTRQLVPITPITPGEFPLPRTPKHSPSHVPAAEQSTAEQSTAKQSRAESPSHPPACSRLLHGEDLGSQMALEHQT